MIPVFLEKMYSIQFENPIWLTLILIIPLFILIVWRRRNTASIIFPSIALAQTDHKLKKNKVKYWLAVMRTLSLILLIIGLARPQFGTGKLSRESSGIDIILAVDLSASMWAHDFEIDGNPTDRLTAVKQVMHDFIKKRPNDRIGIVAFAGEAYTVSPLTLNHQWLLDNNLERLEIGLIEDGTAIGTAIGASANRLITQASKDSKSRVVILLTDGANNTGQLPPLAAAEAAASLDIKIYTIGAGREGRVPIARLDSRTGKPLRDRAGNILLNWGISHIDTQTLEAIAEITQAEFFRAGNTQSLVKIYEAIDKLEKTEVTLTEKTNYSEMFYGPVIFGLIIFLIAQVLSQTSWYILP